MVDFEYYCPICKHKLEQDSIVSLIVSDYYLYYCMCSTWIYFIEYNKWFKFRIIFIETKIPLRRRKNFLFR